MTFVHARSPAIRNPAAVAVPRFLLLSLAALLLALAVAPSTRLLSLLRHISPAARTAPLFRPRLLTTTTMASRPTPSPAPKFIDTPDSVLSQTKELIANSKALEDRLVAEIPPEKATFDNVIAKMAEDENAMALKVPVIGFYQYVSTDKTLRDASSKAEEQLQVCYQSVDSRLH